MKNLSAQVGVYRRTDSISKHPLIPVGTKFGRWEVVENGLRKKVGDRMRPACRSRCECGTEMIHSHNILRTGKSTSCHKCAIIPTVDKRSRSIATHLLIPVGTIFGNLEVTENGLYRIYGKEQKRACRVKCLLCGASEIRSCNHLKRGNTQQSCIDCSRKRYGIVNKRKFPLVPVGTRFGRRIVIETDLYKVFGTQTQRACRVQCSCADKPIDIVTCTDLRGGNADSCGCISRERDMETVWRDLHKRLWRTGKDVHLTLSEFQFVSQLPCAYCGKDPSNVCRLKYKVGGRYQRGTAPDMDLRYSGLDRVDSSKGYIHGNIVPCCGGCNWMKRNYGLEEFFERLEGIRTHSNPMLVLGLASRLFEASV